MDCGLNARRFLNSGRPGVRWTEYRGQRHDDGAPRHSYIGNLPSRPCAQG